MCVCVCVSACVHVNRTELTNIVHLQKKKRTTSEYVPAYRSGPYAILIALFRAEEVHRSLHC